MQRAGGQHLVGLYLANVFHGKREHRPGVSVCFHELHYDRSRIKQLNNGANVTRAEVMLKDIPLQGDQLEKLELTHTAGYAVTKRRVSSSRLIIQTDLTLACWPRGPISGAVMTIIRPHSVVSSSSASDARCWSLNARSNTSQASLV